MTGNSFGPNWPSKTRRPNLERMPAPAPSIRQALLAAAADLAACGQGATLREMAACAQVQPHQARWAVRDLRRGGHLRIVGERRVAWRNRPVAEYLPAALAGGPASDLMAVISRWRST